MYINKYINNVIVNLTLGNILTIGQMKKTDTFTLILLLIYLFDNMLLFEARVKIWDKPKILF